MILIFGGTTEGRLAVDVCEQAGKTFYYSTKSDLQEVKMQAGVRLAGTMTADEIALFCQEHAIQCIVDAAHPFATNLHRAIATIGLPVIRLQRDFGERKDGVVYCADYTDAIAKISAQPPRLLLALSGANTIAKLRPYWQKHPTLFRVLDRSESRQLAFSEGFPTHHLIYYKSDICSSKILPTKAEERVLMEELGCDAIITKESGESGGFAAKVDAALELGLRVFVVQHPELPQDWTYVTGRHGLRRAIEHFVPSFFPLKTGFTTGACATAATKAALQALLCDEAPEEVFFALPDGEVMNIPIESVESDDLSASATVVKDFSDDPDVTRGCRITARVEWIPGHDVAFRQGEGVGVVTLPGLGIPVGGPAINPTPRRMIINEIRQLTDRGVAVTISVEGGSELAKRTFNPKVGVVDGISIIGTSGIVSPLSNEAFVQSICRELAVAKAIGCDEIAIVSGKKGEDALRQQAEQRKVNAKEDQSTSAFRCIHYGNFVGETLKEAARLGIQKVTVGIMIGKAVKLAEGHLDTHSHKVAMNKAFLKEVVQRVVLTEELASYQAVIDQITMARELWQRMPQAFFEEIRRLCYEHCRSVFPKGGLDVQIIRDSEVLRL